MVTISVDGTAEIWNACTGQCTQTLSGQTSAAFSADGATVLTASADETANIWNARTGQCTQILYGQTSAAHSADGATVLTAPADGTAKIWNACTGQCTQTLSGQTSAAFSADGATVVTAPGDGAVKIWNADMDADTICDKCGNQCRREELRVTARIGLVQQMAEAKWLRTPFAIVRQSVLARRATDGNSHWACSAEWRKQSGSAHHLR